MKEQELSKILDNMYKQALLAKQENEVPIACCIYSSSYEIYAHNQVEKNNSPFDHAEFLAIEEAMKTTSSKYLNDAVLIVSLEPCLLCMGAILKAGISKLFYIDENIKDGAFSKYHVFIGNQIEILQLKDDRFSTLLKDFFKNIRNEDK